MNRISPEDFAALESIVAGMERAWNAADGQGFAAAFAMDADQVNIFGDVLNGRPDIAERHDRIFNTIFRGSSNALRLVEARYVNENVVLARMSSTVVVPQGPLAGELRTLASLLFHRTESGWELLTLHNTRVSSL